MIQSHCLLSAFRLSSALLALTLAAILWCAPQARAAEPQFLPGARVGLVPPAGFIPSMTFPGYENHATGVKLAVLELPGAAFSELSSVMFSGDVTPQGVVIEGREMFATADDMAYLVSGRQLHEGKQVRRWFLLGRASDLTVFISVEIPEAATATLPDAVIRAALASVTLRPRPTEEALGLLPFEVTNFAKFRVVHVSPEVLILTDGPSDEQIAEQPYFLLWAVQGGTIDSDDRSRFAQQTMNSVPYADLRIISAEPLRIQGQAGYEVRAEAKDPASGERMSLVQWIRFPPGGGFLRMLGIVRAADWAGAFPRFRAIRDGVALR